MKTAIAKNRKIIRDLLDAARDGALVELQDGGKRVDVVCSHRKGRTNEVMTLGEVEQRMDRAIRMAWWALNYTSIQGDPVATIYLPPRS